MSPPWRAWVSSRRDGTARRRNERRVGPAVPVKDDETDYRPTVTLRRMSEKDWWGAAVERAEVCGAGESDGWKDAELGVDKEPKQERQEEAGGGDLLPYMDRADPLLSGSRRTLMLLRIGGRGGTTCGEPVRSGVEGPVLSGVEGLRRTREQKPEEAAERAGITMIVGVGHQEQEPDGEQDHRRCHATTGDAFVSSPHPC